MELDELLSAMDRTAANLVKLEQVWDRAGSSIPTGPSRGSHPEYDDLCPTWLDLLPGLPPSVRGAQALGGGDVADADHLHTADRTGTRGRERTQRVPGCAWQ